MSTVTLTTQAVADLVGGRLAGASDVVIRRARALESAAPDDIAMCVSRSYASRMATSRAGAVLVPEALAGLPTAGARIVVSDPAVAMTAVIDALDPRVPTVAAIAPTVRIAGGAQIGAGASIGEYAVIGAHVRIGARAAIGPHVVIGDDVVLGDDVRLDAHATIYAGVTIGNRVHVKAGAVIGGAGFGYAPAAPPRHRIRHVGGCIIEDDVDIGSNSCIDRGSLDDTRIGCGTKIDNLVHIAHNVQTGPDCLMMAGVGIAGSTRLGARVILAGHSGCADHVAVGDDVRIAAQSVVIDDVGAGATVNGYPARPHREFLRAIAGMYRLAPYARVLEAIAQRDADA